MSAEPASSYVVVDPEFDAHFDGYYLEGLRTVFGVSRVRYAHAGFPRGHRCFAFRVEPGGLRICIDSQDLPSLREAALGWCDLYGKVNVSPSSAEPTPASVLAVGPSFGIRLWGLAGTAAAAVGNRLRVGAGRSTSEREFFANYWRQLRYRTWSRAYAASTAEPDYVFFTGSLWAKEPACNTYRAAFMEICRQRPGLRFEGGFAPRVRGDVPGFEALTVARRYTFREYLDGTRRSAVVFNTPAVAGCLGWKLGEFLALGKAIVSTPLLRVMPAPLEHGKHVHFVDGSPEGIRDAVDRILGDAGYRRRLETGARAYFDEYLSPRRVIERLVAAGR